MFDYDHMNFLLESIVKLQLIQVDSDRFTVEEKRKIICDIKDRMDK